MHKTPPPYTELLIPMTATMTPYQQSDLEQMNPAQLREASTHCFDQPGGITYETYILIPPTGGLRF